MELVNSLNKKETYRCHDRDDLDYYGIRDIGNLFSNVEDYYRLILVEILVKIITNIMKAEKTKAKDYQ